MKLRSSIGVILIVGGLVAGSTAVRAYDGTWFSCPDGSGYLSTPNNQIVVSQGQTASIPIEIHRVGCTGDITLLLWYGTPPTATATFSPNPTTGSTEMLSVKTTTATPVGDLDLSLGVSTGANYPDVYLPIHLHVNPSIAPIEAAPRSGFATGAVIGSTTTPVRTSWSATDPDGIARYAVQRSVDGGAWANVSLPTATTRAISQSLRYGHRYQYRVRATDKLGHTSAWIPGRAFVPRIYQQTTTRFTSAWAWKTVSTSLASGGSLKYQPYSGADFSYTFTGSSVAWVGVAGPNRVNSFAVWIDGVLAASHRSLNRSTVQYRRIAYAANWSTDVRHTYRVQDFGQIGHSRIDVDAFVVLDQV